MSATRIHGLYVIIDPDAGAGRDAAGVARLALDGGASILQWRAQRRHTGEPLPDPHASRAPSPRREATLLAPHHSHPATSVAAPGGRENATSRLSRPGRAHAASARTASMPASRQGRRR